MKRRKEELELLNRYGVTKFSEFTKEMILDMQPKLAEMDPEVARAIIAQIPGYAQFSNEFIRNAKDLAGQVVEADQKETLLSYEMDNKVADCLVEQLRRNDLLPEEREFIVEKLLTLRQQTIDAEANKRRDHISLVKTISFTGLALAYGLVTLFGGHTRFKIPFKA